MLNRQEILRYMGVPSSNDTFAAMIDRAEAEVAAAARPKHIYKHISIEADSTGGRVLLAGTPIQSRDLSRHLEGCREGFLFACTLGVGIDSLVKKYSFTEIPILPVVQAVSAAYIENYADTVQKELEEYAAKSGLFLRPRYSPGYGDFQLSCQRFLFDALQISKNIGVSLTDSFLMVPFKSVTAVIGLSDDSTQCHINNCMTCNAIKCPFRKESE